MNVQDNVGEDLKKRQQEFDDILDEILELGMISAFAAYIYNNVTLKLQFTFHSKFYRSSSGSNAYSATLH